MQTPLRGEIMSDFVIKDTVFTDMSVKRAEEALLNVSLKSRKNKDGV